MSDVNEAGDTGAGFDLDASLEEVASEIAKREEPTTQAATDPLTPPVATTEQKPATDAPATTDPAATTTPAPRPPPKSWAKEKHDIWGKLPPDAQDYYEQRERQMLDGLEQYKGDATYGKGLKDVFAPYLPHLKALGYDEPKFAGELLNSYYQLTSGSPEQRQAVYRQIGVDLGLVQREGEPTDPHIAGLNRQIRTLETRLSAREQAEQDQRRERADAESKAFAADPANVHLTEVVADMLPYVRAGLSLKDAYEKAVWANPVTRQKEQAKLDETRAAELREKAKAEAEAARRASGVNVRDAKTQKAPTEPKGTWDDTMRDTLKSIKGRA